MKTFTLDINQSHPKSKTCTIELGDNCINEKKVHFALKRKKSSVIEDPCIDVFVEFVYLIVE